jgi:hypothetical protein
MGGTLAVSGLFVGSVSSLVYRVFHLALDKCVPATYGTLDHAETPPKFLAQLDLCRYLCLCL